MARGFGFRGPGEFGPPDVDPEDYFHRVEPFGHPGSWQDRNHDGIPDSLQDGFGFKPPLFGGHGFGVPDHVPFDVDGDGRPDFWASGPDRFGRHAAFAWDTNGDGIPDQWAWDHDRDGRAEQWAWDHNNDGHPDQWAWDNDHDGMAEHWAWDHNRDGRAEAWGWDEDGDGKPDIFGYDQNRDGKPDYWVSASRHGWDTTGRGRPDLWGVDRDGDGKIEYYERDTTGDGKPDLAGIAYPKGNAQTAWPDNWAKIESSPPERPLPPRSNLPTDWTRFLEGAPDSVVAPPVLKGLSTDSGLKPGETAPEQVRSALKPPPGVAYRFPVPGDWYFKDTWGAPRMRNRSHRGVDIFAKEGTPVFAICDGEVVMVFDKGSAGLTVRFAGDDGNGYEYQHLSRLSPALQRELQARIGATSPSKGQHKRLSLRVEADDELGAVGRTGFRPGSRTEAHLHFQAFPNHKFRLDPATGVDERGDPYDILRSALPGGGGRSRVDHFDFGGEK